MLKRYIKHQLTNYQQPADTLTSTSLPSLVLPSLLSFFTTSKYRSINMILKNQCRVSAMLQLQNSKNEKHFTSAKLTGKCPDARAFKQFGGVTLVVLKFFQITVDHVANVPVKASVAGCRRLLDRRHRCRPPNLHTFTHATSQVRNVPSQHAGIINGKGKVLPYSLPSVAPRADPAVQAVSPQVTLSHPPGSRLPFLSAKPAVTFPAEERHCPSASTKLYCLVT